MTSSITPFDFDGTAVRVVTDEGGEPWFVLADLCRILGLVQPGAVARRLADDEKGVRLTHTPGGEQQMLHVNEAGMWTVILRSDSPAAEPVRRWVTHEVLPTIRRTGQYGSAPAQFDLTSMENVALVIEAAQQALARVRVLEAPAAAWESLADAAGDYSLRDAAQILDRDPAIATGQNRLARYLRTVRWLDASGTPYQRYVEQGLLCSRARHYDHPRTGERMLSTQVRVTAKGLGRLHELLGGDAPLDASMRALSVVTA
ncbi:phage antirepressor protein KilAC domain-containing protein [Sediminihabitans luteus]|uniref:Phage antirepressor protein KilAC domain-containing protein n=1 Tax=Sediminihabitans luteus TaxID=1138585 RepID=A0A2M9D043_9CELL|nr:phage antirepressor KilAC domain-containing protein [Sediminihabitans luteus]PJJ77463.1 phage antirepressor protein KilAC domain-containing protein [Sediminihabitans luteus]GII98357.1 antirepressor [Sediminihabitans luteus]